MASSTNKGDGEGGQSFSTAVAQYIAAGGIPDHSGKTYFSAPYGQAAYKWDYTSINMSKGALHDERGGTRGFDSARLAFAVSRTC
jgi:hypothetical protein